MKEKEVSIWVSISYYITFGFELAFCLVIGLSIGLFIQKFFNWKPWGLILGLFLGIGAMIKTFIRVSRHIQKDDDHA